MPRTCFFLPVALFLTSQLVAASPHAIQTKIKADLRARPAGASFSKLTEKWERSFGTSAVSALFEIASDRKLEDAERFIALMSAARLGGKKTTRLVEPFLKDSCWMLRSGALRALGVLSPPEAEKAARRLLKDPALVVRKQAALALRSKN